ncbi:hypothetical protein ACWGHM_40230 [Streptomyces sp. NPDC054904]
MHSEPDEGAAGMAGLEGYLINQAALTAARKEGHAFARSLSWLGPDEQQAVADRFVRHHLNIHRNMLVAELERGRELHHRYRRRCAQLRLCLCALLLTSHALVLSITIR